MVHSRKDEVKEAIAGCGKLPERADATLAEFSLAPNAESQRRIVMDAFQVRLLGEEMITLTLPAGISRIEFLQMVQEAAKVYKRDAIHPPLFEVWAKHKEFTTRPVNDVVMTIDGNVEGSTSMTRSEQEAFLNANGLQMPTLSDLAVAHAAYFLADGDDLFCEAVVRALGGALEFDLPGLFRSDYYYRDEKRYHKVATSASLPARNKKT